MYDEVYGYTEIKIIAGDTAIVPIDIPVGFGEIGDNDVLATVFNETSSCNTIEDVPALTSSFNLPSSFTSTMSGKYLIKFKIKNKSTDAVKTVSTRLLVGSR